MLVYIDYISRCQCFYEWIELTRVLSTIFIKLEDYFQTLNASLWVHGWYFCPYTLWKYTWASCKIIYQTGWLLNALQRSKMWGYCWFLLHHKVILFYESESFFSGGGGRGDMGLFWASCSEGQNMGCDEVKWT